MNPNVIDGTHIALWLLAALVVWLARPGRVDRDALPADMNSLNDRPCCSLHGCWTPEDWGPAIEAEAYTQEGMNEVLECPVCKLPPAAYGEPISRDGEVYVIRLTHALQKAVQTADMELLAPPPEQKPWTPGQVSAALGSVKGWSDEHFNYLVAALIAALSKPNGTQQA